jgi:aminoglycoside phosphotransferase (APT) family kinase protein
MASDWPTAELLPLDESEIHRLRHLISLAIEIPMTHIIVVGRFSLGAINRHYLFSVNEDGANSVYFVWRERGSHALPVPMQNSLDEERELIAWLRTFSIRNKIPAIKGRSTGNGILFDYSSGVSAPEAVIRKSASVDLTVELASFLAELHALPLPDNLTMISGTSSLPNVFRSARHWLGNEKTPVAKLLVKEIEWLAGQSRFEQSPTVVCHNDFRTGNFLLDDHGLVKVLDWEFACFGQREQDIGWLTAPCWRCGQEKPVGGFGDLQDFISVYENRLGVAVDQPGLLYWQYVAQIRWGVIALIQEWRLSHQGLVADYTAEPWQEPGQVLRDAELIKRQFLAAS